MRCLIAIFVLFLLAGPVNDRRAPAPAPEPARGVHVDRHVEAHVPTRDGEPPAGVSDDRSERHSGPDPASGVTSSPPAPPAIQWRGDPLSRDRRY